MSGKFTEKELKEAQIAIAANESVFGTICGAILGVIIGLSIWLLFAILFLPPVIAVPVLLFISPAFVGFLAGELGKPFSFLHKLIIFSFGIVVYAPAFIIYSRFNIYLSLIAGFVAVFFSTLHMSEVQKYTLKKIRNKVKNKNAVSGMDV